MDKLIIIKDLLKYISINSGILPILFFLVFYNRNKGKIVWVLCFYILVSLITDHLLVTFEYSHKPLFNFTILSLFTIFEFVLFSYFIFALLKSRTLKRILLSIGIAFLALAGFEYYRGLNVNSVNGLSLQIDSFSVTIECIILIIFCILFFYEQINKPEIILIYESYSFWAITGILLYLAGGLFFYIYVEDLSKAERHAYWNIIYTVNILKNILFAIVFLMRKKTVPIYTPNYMIT